MRIAQLWGCRLFTGFICAPSVPEFLWDRLRASIRFPVMPKGAQYARFSGERLACDVPLAPKPRYSIHCIPSTVSELHPYGGAPQAGVGGLTQLAGLHPRQRREGAGAGSNTLVCPYYPIMPDHRRALCPVRRGVITGIRPYARYQTPGIRPYARCHCHRVHSSWHLSNLTRGD
eukprot:COSAG02_NODE_1818_length_10774_cov_4.788009_5_plen_174_part_00